MGGGGHYSDKLAVHEMANWTVPSPGNAFDLMDGEDGFHLMLDGQLFPCSHWKDLVYQNEI